MSAQPIPAVKAVAGSSSHAVNCGDCGRWDPEAVPQVIAARAALAETAITEEV